MWQEEEYTIQGTSPLVMHNVELSDPLNEYVKKLKPLTAKRTKTDAIWEEIAHLEFLGGLYWNGKEVVLPPRMIKKSLVLAAQKSRQGSMAKIGLRCQQEAILEYEGPRTPEELWQDTSFRYRAMATVQKSKIPRMRPIFHEWKTTLHLLRNTDIVNENILRRWVEAAGELTGFAEMRPEKGGEFGCFELIS